MHPVPSHSGEMSQGSRMADEHRKPVPALDPVARKTKRAFENLSASAVGMEVGLSVVIGILIGMWLDRTFGTSPWLLIVWLIFGVAAGFTSAIRAMRRVDRAERRDEEARHG